MMRVLLIDDHRLVRHGVRKLLVEQLGATVGEADDVEGALAAIEDSDWDVIVLDITLRDASGLDLLKQIPERRSQTPVLILSMHPVDQFARRVMSAGALGYVTKDSTPAELVDAVQQVARGRPFVGESARLALASARNTYDSLSDREYQVLRMIASGKTVSETADALGISVKTVSTYRARLLQKLGMRTNAELMRYGLQEGLVD